VVINSGNPTGQVLTKENLKEVIWKLTARLLNSAVRRMYSSSLMKSSKIMFTHLIRVSILSGRL
jgi:hypothetical protein